MMTVHTRPSAAFSSFQTRNTATSGQPRRQNPLVKAALLGLFATPMLSSLAAAQEAGPGTTKQAVFPEILVKGKQDGVRAAGSRTAITADELERNNVTGMSGIVRYEPLISAPLEASGSGSVWDGSGNTGYNIRGIEGNRVSLDVDGISLPDAAPKPDGATLNSFGVGRDYFDPETLREVRIASGASAAGAATPGLGGSVALVTKSPEDYLDEGRATYASYKLGRSSANRAYAHTLAGAARIGSMQALAVLVHRNGHANKSLGDSPLNPDDWDSNAVLSKLVWALPGEQKLDVTVDAYQRKNRRAYDNKQGALYPEGARQDAATRRTRLSIGHLLISKEYAWFDSLESKVYLQDSKVEDLTHARYVTGGQNYLRAITTGYFNNSFGFAAEAFKQAGPGHALSYGLSAETTSTRRPWFEDRTVVGSGAHQITMKNRMADMDTTRLSAHLRDEFSFALGGRKAMLTPGLRVEYRNLKPKNLEQYVIAVPAAATEIKEESDIYLTPGLSLSVELTPGLDIYGLYSRGTRLPSAAERTGTYDSFSYTGAGNGYAVLGNPDLNKEISNAFEIGLKGAPGKGLTFRSALFYTQYKNLIEYQAQAADPVNYPTISFGLFRPENVGNARTWGGEVSARAELGAWSPAMQGYHAAVAAGVAHGSAENTATGESKSLASVAPYKGSASFGYDHPAQQFGLALTVTRVGAKQAPDDVISGINTPRFHVPGHTLLDLSSYWNIGKHAKLIVGVYNLGDRKYWEYASSRGLAADTGALAHANIERQAMPGRNISASLSVNF